LTDYIDESQISSTSIQNLFDLSQPNTFAYRSKI